MARPGLGVLLLFLAGCAAAPAPVGGPASAPAAPDGAELAAPPGAAPPASPYAPDPELTAADDPDALEDGEDHEEVDDGLELPPDPATAPPQASRSPLAAMTDPEIEDKLAKDPAALGSMSIGSTNAGALLNGVSMPEDDRWVLVDPNHCWGTRETVDYLTRAIGEVHRRYPGSPKLYIGHISGRRGGWLSPHISHQAGRDVDISYFLDARHRWYARATANNLDRERTWAFVRALVTETDVEIILIDSSVQRLLKDHAAKIGEDPAWLDTLFQVGSKHARPLIRHAKGHATHIHVRFYNPIAQESAVRAYPMLVKHGLLKTAPQAAPDHHYVRHTVKKGQTLGVLAKRYGTTVEAIQKANGLKGTFVREKRTLNIPKAGGPPPRRPASTPAQPQRVAIPPRRLPPAKPASPPA